MYASISTRQVKQPVSYANLQHDKVWNLYSLTECIAVKSGLILQKKKLKNLLLRRTAYPF